jgi:hypothetical protein
MMSGVWTVKLDSRIRPIVEAIAHEEGRDPANMVRRLVDKALADRAIAQRPSHPNIISAAELQTKRF